MEIRAVFLDLDGASPDALPYPDGRASFTWVECAGVYQSIFQRNGCRFAAGKCDNNDARFRLNAACAGVGGAPPLGSAPAPYSAGHRFAPTRSCASTESLARVLRRHSRETGSLATLASLRLRALRGRAALRSINQRSFLRILQAEIADLPLRQLPPDMVCNQKYILVPVPSERGSLICCAWISVRGSGHYRPPAAARRAGRLTLLETAR
jgi:hypothetical protein